MTDFQIRAAISADIAEIDQVHRSAFPTDLESRLVHLLISHNKNAVSLVACRAQHIVGHILFSPAKYDGPAGRSEGLGLAPLAVIPEFQNCGIGSALVRAGLEKSKELAAPWVVVLGEPIYYSRFGFEPASRYSITGEFGGGGAFQILAFDLQRRPPAAGYIQYASEFRELLSS